MASSPNPDPAPAPAPKPIYQSKTAVVNAIIALAPLYPPAELWIEHNATTTLVVIGLVNILLRVITKGKIVLFGGGSGS